MFLQFFGFPTDTDSVITLTRFGTMGTTSPGFDREEQGAYHELAHSAQGHRPGGP
jgi:hypothetical protein